MRAWHPHDPRPKRYAKPILGHVLIGALADTGVIPAAETVFAVEIEAVAGEIAVLRFQTYGDERLLDAIRAGAVQPDIDRVSRRQTRRGRR